MTLLYFYVSFFRRWLKFYFNAGTRHDVHSPFVSEFIQEVVENRRNYYTFFIVEKLRKKLLSIESGIKITDYGAGSMVRKDNVRTISDLARFAAISPRLGRIIFNITRIYKPGSVLELGTSLGISTLYLAGAAPHARMITIEGCPETAKTASNNLRNLGMSSIMVRTGPFKENLLPALEDLQQLDLLYLDGDHLKGATLTYYEQCLEYAHEYSVFIIADIHWSSAMEEAWEVLKNREEVTLSIDLFHFGVLFFRKEFRVKATYSIVPYRWKPWRMGFF